MKKSEYIEKLKRLVEGKAEGCTVKQLRVLLRKYK